MNGILYSEEEIKLIKDNYYKMTNNELSNLIYEKLHIKRSPDTITRKCSDLGLKKEHNWNDLQEKWLIDNCKNYSSYITMSKDFNKKFSLNLSNTQIIARIKKLGLKLNTNIFVFTKQHKEWIKENYIHYSNYEDFTKDFEEKFDVKIKQFTLSNYCANNKIKLTERKTMVYTKEQEQWIIDNFNDNTLIQLVKKFNEKFDENLCVSTFEYKIRKLGLTKGLPPKYSKEECDYLKELSNLDLTFNEIYEIFSKRYNRTYKSVTTTFYKTLGLKVKTNKEIKYTQEHFDYIKNNISNYRKNGCFDYDSFLNDFNKHFNLNMNRKRLEGVCHRQKISFGIVNRKELMKTLNRQKYKIGDTIIRSGKEYVKINDTNSVDFEDKWQSWKLNWKAKDRIVYEQYYNCVLTSDDVIVHKDNDLFNCEIDNLLRMDRKEYELFLGHSFRFIENEELKKTAIMVCQLESKLKEVIK